MVPMRIVIIGAGFTGIQLAKLLVNEKNQVALIDNDEDVIRHASNQLDCTVLCADGNSLDTLEDVGIAKADALVCVTSSDEVNMITCSLVDAVYPEITKIARVRNYAYYVNTASAQKKHSTNFGGKKRPLYGIDYMIHPDVEAAEAIVQAVKNGAIGSVVSFNDSEHVIARIVVAKGSQLDGITLKDIRSKVEVPFLIAYIENDGKTSLPFGDTLISAGTTIGALVSKSDLTQLTQICGATQNALNKIALIGAGRIGTIVTERLLKSNKNSILPKFLSSLATKKTQEFTIIDKDEEIAKTAAEKFPEAKVMNADASDEVFLKEEGITSYDLAICCTHNHEMNMILAAYLESLGVKQTVSLVASSAFAQISEKLGIDVSVPLRDTVVDSIMSHLRGKSVKEIHTVTNGQLEIVECEVTLNSKANGKYLKEIADPGKFLVLMNKLSGTSEYKISNGNTKLSVGDNVVLITVAEESKKILSSAIKRYP